MQWRIDLQPTAALLLWALLALSVSTAAQALSSDSEKPIQLNADKAQLDNTTGTSVYTGDVVMTQGTLKVTGDVMHVYTNDRHRIERVVVEGSPATYRQLPDGQQQYVRAEAPRMEYFASGPERVRLLQGGKLWQGPNTFTGETIVYDVAKDQVQASSGESGNNRIQITIYPNKKDQAESGGKAPAADKGK